jgi:hypothetical protein
MKLLKITKRHNEHERCLCLWTPWITVVLDFGSVQCRGTDEFELVIKYRAYGPVFYFGNRDVEKLGERNKFDSFQFTRIQPRYAELRKKRIDDRDFFENREQLVREGKRKNPANMTYAERHAATMDAVKKMKFSDNFMHLMTTPVAKLALERGEESRDDKTGELLTEEIFRQHKEQNPRLAVRNVGILGFKKAESGEGYEAICVPGMELRKVASSSDLKMLGGGE